MIRVPVFLLLFVCCQEALCSVGEVPVWPIADTPFPGRSQYADFLQPTASGTPESALFGCVRNDGNRFHEADDIAPVKPRRKGEVTDPIIAAHDGLIAHINRIAGNSSYGRYVVVEHADLSLPVYTLYAHLSRVEPSLKAGDTIRAGETLGIMGRSAGGYSIPRSRAHLHFEVGLRITSAFQKWYDQQGFTSQNHHGEFNGMNLVSWDPLDYYSAFASGAVDTVVEYLNTIPPAALLHVRDPMVPDYLMRYPQLMLPGCEEEERAGWEIMLSAWGLPLSFRALDEAELKGVRKSGEVSIVAVDRGLLEQFECRKIISFDGNTVTLDKGGRQILELLFMMD